MSEQNVYTVYPVSTCASPAGHSSIPVTRKYLGDFRDSIHSVINNTH